jgi:hypothetical protein
MRLIAWLLVVDQIIMNFMNDAPAALFRGIEGLVYRAADPFDTR